MVDVFTPERWWAGVGRSAAVVMSVEGRSKEGVEIVFDFVRANKGGRVDVILLMVTRQLIVM